MNRPQIVLRANAAEKAALEARAQAAGVTVSNLIRDAVGLPTVGRGRPRTSPDVLVVTVEVSRDGDSWTATATAGADRTSGEGATPGLARVQALHRLVTDVLSRS